MQVRKFEARTMKEALEMVKTQLGPDAIILSARDNSKKFGLVGQGSVEITAAVSEETLQKKKFAESKLREQDKARLMKSPARIQKSYIEKVVNKHIEESKPRPQITQRPYIEIDDGEMQLTENYAMLDESMQIEPESAETRIKSAAQRAWNAMHVGGGLAEFMNSPSKAPQTSSQAVVETEEIKALRNELANIKQVLAQFQKMPQTIVTQHPGAEYGIPYGLSQTYEKLTLAGLAKDIVVEMLTEAQKKMPPIRFKNNALVEGWVARSILDSTKIVDNPHSEKIQIFVGPAGSGKTSTLVKLASNYVVKDKKKVALVTTDTMKVGSSDQLRIYAQILNVPFAVIRSQGDWAQVLTQLRGYDYILCDCAGLSLKTLEEIQMLKNLLPTTGSRAVHLVLSATDKDEEISELGRRYKAIQYKDVIFTGLDEALQHGSVYNFMKKFAVPLHSFGIGPRVPEDYEFATRERVLDLIFKLSKMKSKEAI